MKIKLLMSVMLMGTLVWIGCTQAEKKGTTVQPGFPTNSTTSTAGDDGDNDEQPDCAETICTEYIAEISLAVSNASGQPVLLDAFHTEDMSGNVMPAYLYEYNDITESYIVFNDGWISGNENSSITVRFVGTKNGNKVVDEVFNIQTDCCHVSKTEGNDEVVIND